MKHKYRRPKSNRKRNLILLTIFFVAVIGMAIVFVLVANSPPVAAFTDSATSAVYTTETVTFNGADSYDTDGRIVSYSWDFGDGSTATGATASHAYAQAGSYTVALTVTDDDGATDTMAANKNVYAAGSEAGQVLLKTNMGDITIELYDDMPITTANFKNLVQQGVYNGTIFHRVIDGFMVQGGDPTGTGYGDPSIPTIPDEFTDHNWNDRGTVAMANSGENTGSSQFFINLVDNDHLNDAHPVFGIVVEGMDVVDSIGEVETDENDRPLEDVRIIEAVLIG
jgi:peptidylprolyl isomerase